MRLQDWQVQAELVPYGMIDAVANANVCLTRKSCFIRLAKDSSHDYIPQNDEHSLVHELLHIHFEPFHPERDTLMYELWEMAVDQLAVAFVSLDGST